MTYISPRNVFQCAVELFSHWLISNMWVNSIKQKCRLESRIPVCSDLWSQGVLKHGVPHTMCYISGSRLLIYTTYMNKSTSFLQTSKHDNIPATPVKQEHAKLIMITKWKKKYQTENVRENNKSSQVKSDILVSRPHPSM